MPALPSDGFHCESEEEIFAALSLTWREPTERNVFDVKDGAVGKVRRSLAAHRRQKRLTKKFVHQISRVVGFGVRCVGCGLWLWWRRVAVFHFLLNDPLGSERALSPHYSKS